MKTEQKRVKLYDGTVTEVLRGSSSVQVELECGAYKKGEGYVKERTTQRLDNPAQAEGLEPGMKIAIFTDAAGKTNLVRNGEWKASSVMAEHKGRQYDDGVTVIMGRCIGARLIKPKDGQGFKPFFSMSVVTNDHVLHEIYTRNTESQYGTDNIERIMKNFQQFLANDKHGFIPFTGTFLTGVAYQEEEQERNGYHNVVRKYNGSFGLGLLNGKSIISYDYEKAPERSHTQEQSQAQEQEQAHTSLDTNVEMGEEAADGFMNIPDGIDEELPFE